MTPSAARVLGVNLAVSSGLGVAYLALAESPGVILLEDPVEITPSPSIPGVEQLREFGMRFAHEVKRLHVGRVVVAEPRPRPAPWKYAEAHIRVSLETAMGLATIQHATASFVTMKPAAAAKCLGLTDGKELPTQLQERVSGKVAHWKERATALLVALASLKG